MAVGEGCPAASLVGSGEFGFVEGGVGGADVEEAGSEERIRV